jgi:hypothetical protein
MLQVQSKSRLVDVHFGNCKMPSRRCLDRNMDDVETDVLIHSPCGLPNRSSQANNLYEHQMPFFLEKAQA